MPLCRAPRFAEAPRPPREGPIVPLCRASALRRRARPPREGAIVPLSRALRRRARPPREGPIVPLCRAPRLDASVALSWCFEDEADAAGDALLKRLASGRATVPGLWPLEIANVLLAAERRQRITPAASARFLALLDALPIEVDAHTATRASREVLLLARAHGLSSYDAAYLDLAARSGLALAMRDAALNAAAEALGLERLLA